MSIDYDRLRELADTARPGPWEVKAEETSTCGDLIEGLAAWIEADNELVFGRGMEIEEDEELTNLALAALAPDLAAEVIRLREGLVRLQRDMRHQPHQYLATEVANAIRIILQGETNGTA